jgi:hypothetical protein
MGPANIKPLDQACTACPEYSRGAVPNVPLFGLPFVGDRLRQALQGEAD